MDSNITKNESDFKFSYTLMADTRQQANKHTLKDKYFESIGIKIVRSKLPVGDYTLMQNMSVVIDTKKDVQELVGDICGNQHERFRNELILAQENGIKLIILVENRGGYLDKKCTIYNPTIYDLESLHNWKNPRAFITRGGRQVYPTATKGIVLQKACMTMQLKYGVEFKFCRPDQSGEMILKLLGVKGEENGRSKNVCAKNN